jgi:hypothetical protein
LADQVKLVAAIRPWVGEDNMGSSKGRRRTEFVGIWLFPEEKAALEQVAQGAGTTIGAAVRAGLAMTRDAGPRAEVERPRATELAPAGDDPSYGRGREENNAVRQDRALTAADLSQQQREVAADAVPAAETASDIAMVALAQICYQLFECRLVLEALPYEVDLNLDELMRDISTAQQSAREAYSATSLLHKSATLEDRCDTSPSRPDAIVARHRAAVAAGAPLVAPDRSRTDEFNDGLNEYHRPDRSQDIVGPRPNCKAVLRDGSRRCTKPALYLGGGSWAQTCYVHATTADRDRFRGREGLGVDAGKVDERTRKEVLLVFGRAVMFSWADAHDEASQASAAPTSHRPTQKSGSRQRRV